MNKALALCLALLVSHTGMIPNLSAAPLDPDDPQVWSVHGGTMELEIRGDFLPDFGLEVLHEGRPVETRERIRVQVVEEEPVLVRAPYGNLESVVRDMGRLQIETGLVLRSGDREVSLESLTLVTDEHRGHPLFRALDEQGRLMFTMTHMHILAEHQRDLLTVQNAEVEASAELAGLLGLDALADMPIGLGWLDLAMVVPEDADISGTGPGCSDRPIWPQDGQFEAEVGLIGMSNIAYQGTEPGTGRIKTAPSATLKNLSLADIPWIQQFNSHPDYPHDPEDQHPFLVWNIYKITDGRIRMLAESGVKHAFLTINVNCDLNCGDGNILWPGCEDTYSSGNNDTSTYQGPKGEIEASLGLWDNCGSFFDPECNGSQSGFSGQWLNRLLIDPDEFQQPDTSYFMDAWYVIQYDTNIWSTMGYRPIDPQPSGSGWTFNPGTYVGGRPVVDEWVAEDNSDPMADHQIILVPSATPDEPYPGNMPQGHLRLLVQVTEVESGRYRYNYALQNFDFDRGVQSLSLPLADWAVLFDSWFGGVEGVNDKEWDVIRADGEVHFDSPEDEDLPWFTLFNYEIEVDAPPVNGNLELGLGGDASVPTMSVKTIVPLGDGPALAVSPQAVDFGTVLVGAEAVTATVSLENFGNETLNVSGIEPLADVFGVDTKDCGAIPLELEPGTDCELVVTFAPGEGGNFVDTLRFQSDAENVPAGVTLEGTGLPPEIFEDRFEGAAGLVTGW